MAGNKLAWWLSFAGSRASCVVETPERGGVLEALALARLHACAGRGEIRATFLPAAEMEREVPRRLWYRLRTVPQWRACGVDADVDAVPPGMEPCPLCRASDAPGSRAIH
ncbi:MAG: hypothetical protein ACREQY_00400 [Candidatus Binatia bacterium]